MLKNNHFPIEPSHTALRAFATYVHDKVFIGVIRLEFIISFAIGFLFLVVGVVAFFPPTKFPWIVRFIILYTGAGYISYSIVRLVGWVSS